METESAPVTEPADRVLVVERVFDAPRDLVFKAWTEPEHRMHWMGPRGFTSVSCEMDVRPGGSYRFHMRSPEGTDRWQRGVYREVREPERLVCTYVWTDAHGNPTRPETVLTVTFDDYQGKTRLKLHQAVFESVEARDLHGQGWTSALDCFAQYLAAAGRGSAA